MDNPRSTTNNNETSNKEKEEEETKHVSNINTDKPTVNTNNPLPLDWTQLNNNNALSTTTQKMTIRYPTDVMDISKDASATYLEIIGTAGQKITNMGPDLYRYCSPNLTHLILRSHLISKMEGIKGFQHLELLELYDNAIESLNELNGILKPSCEQDTSISTSTNSNNNDDDNTMDDSTGDGNELYYPGCTIKVLDMSYNAIRDMKPVQFCPNLVELYLANNKLKSMAGLRHLTNLRKIDLGANRIRIMDEHELSGLINLEELWLGKNKIEQIQGLTHLTKLRRLDVQSNRLTTIENLTFQVSTLEELYLAHNGIDNDGAMKETGLGLQFEVLTTLDLSRNRLSSCHPFQHLITLNDLWLSYNDIATFEDVEPITNLGTRDGACLEQIYLEHNPIYNDFEYRIKLKNMLPSLEQIDANVIAGNTYSSSGCTSLDRMRQIQDKVFERANNETN